MKLFGVLLNEKQEKPKKQISREERILSNLKCPCCGKAVLDDRLIPMIIQLEIKAEKRGRILKLSSGYRCQKHNDELIARGLKASKNSQHMLGKAFDCMTLDIAERDYLVECAKQIGFKGIGIGKLFCHFDIRDGELEQWTYPY